MSKEFYPQVLIKKIGAADPEWINPGTYLERSRYFTSRLSAEVCIEDFVFFYKAMKNSKYKNFDCDIVDAKILVREIIYSDWSVVEGYKYVADK